MRIVALALTATASAALLTGCMGDDAPRYDAAAYRAGDCRSVSAPVFEIDAAVRSVVADDSSPAAAGATLKTSQEALIDAVVQVDDATTRTAAQRVVDAVGFFRIGVDAKNFTPALATDVDHAASDLLESCAAQ